MKNSEKEHEAFKRGYRVTEDGHLISPTGKDIGYDDGQGYIRASIRINGDKKYFMAHRLQAFQKYGNKLYDPGIEARHLNNIKTDNSWPNIAIGNHSQNMMDIPVQIRIKLALHATSHIRKYDKDKVKKYHAKSKSYKKTMEHFNISSKGTLHFILNSKSKIKWN